MTQKRSGRRQRGLKDGSLAELKHALRQRDARVGHVPDRTPWAGQRRKLAPQ